jgi:hypothetical protein
MSMAYLRECQYQLGSQKPSDNILLIFALARECKLVFRLSIWDFVDTEPLIGSTEKTRQVTLDILDIIQLGGQWVVDVNHNDLPVSLLLVEQCHHSEDLDLLDLACLSNKLTDFADVEWIVVALGLGLWVNDVGIFPCLQ